MTPPIRTQISPSPNISAEEQDRLFVRSAARTLQVLGAFQKARGPMSLSEIAAAAELDRSGAQRLVHTLRRLGYIRRSLDDRGYLPGLKILDHTLDMLRLDPLVQKATPVLLELRKTLKERIDLSLYDETRMVYALRMQSKRETFYATLVGHSVPTFCTAGGRAALSLLDDAAVSEILERSELAPITAHTKTDPEAILDEIRTARRDGYAVIEEEYLPGEVAVGVPLSLDGAPIGAIHVGGSLSEWDRNDFSSRVIPLAMEAGQAILAGF